MGKIGYITGGVTAPLGFTANGIHCGVRKNRTKKDLAIILSERIGAAAAVYTTNAVKGAPIAVTKENIADGYASGFVCNSGIANTCAPNGIRHAQTMCAEVAASFGVKANDIIVASTGVIGQELPIDAITSGIRALKGTLTKEGGEDAATAIMTTDTIKKEAAATAIIGGKKVTIGGIAKGSGMIHPNMATMLVFVTTDADITPELLKVALKASAEDTFNMLSVDGDTSTNDTLAIIANGKAENAKITQKGADFTAFKKLLTAVTSKLCKMLARDGEGATKLLVCTVTGAASKAQAKKCARGVISSSLFKAAMCGADANWGRILCAMGYSDPTLNYDKTSVSFSSVKGEIVVCESGTGIEFSEERAQEILLEEEININININYGKYSASAFGCDLTKKYVEINGDYRS